MNTTGALPVSRSSAALGSRWETHCVAYFLSSLARARQSRAFASNGRLHEFSTMPGVHRGCERHRAEPQGGAASQLARRGEPKTPAGSQEGRGGSPRRRPGVGRCDGRGPEPGASRSARSRPTGSRDRGHRGYRARVMFWPKKNKSEEMPIGTIPIDSIFSPVRRVNYTVTPARVGRETDFDRLNLEVWTRRGRSIPAECGGLRREDPQGAALDLHQL